MNMYKWIDRLIYQEDKKAFPLLSFPSVQLLYVTVKELVTDSNYQALGMKMLADKYPMPAQIKDAPSDIIIALCPVSR